MPAAMTREQASAAVAAATAERDGIQANLLDLDGSFGKRLLAGAALSGDTARRWADASAALGRLWETFTVYSGVIDRAALLVGQVRRASSPELAEITALLTGPSIQLARAPAPLAQRDLTESRSAKLSLALAVRSMKADFAVAREVVATAESVWNVLAAGLEDIGEQLRQARRDAAGVIEGMDASEGRADARGSDGGAAVAALRHAEDELARQRAALNADPLAFWASGQVNASYLNLLRGEATEAARQLGSLAAVATQAEQRIAAAMDAVAVAADAARAAAEARRQAAEKITADALPPPLAEDGVLAGRLAGLELLRAGGRWTRLAAELDAIEQQAAAALARYRENEQASAGLLARREELRGLLGAYQAKAARLSAADAGLAASHDEARDLLWTAPCDLAAATAAVTRYQEEILALSRPGARQVSPP